MIARDELQWHKKRMCIDYSQTELDAYPLPRIDDLINKLSQYKVFSTFDLKSAYHQIPTVAGVDQADHDRNVAAFLQMIKRRNITLNESKTVSSVPVIDILGHRISHDSIKPDPER